MANKSEIDVALVYDFDGTLAPGNMQEFGFVQAIGKDPKAFWEKTTELAIKNDASGILCYMYLMLQEARANGISLRRESFQRFGAMIHLFEGVEQWFALINRYGKSKGINIKHYINSSGLKEMIEGTTIAKRFENIYERMIYFGDGETDIPCMKVVKEHGGHSIAVYGDEKKKATAMKLIKEDRVNFVCKADYSEGKEIHAVVTRILDGIC